MNQLCLPRLFLTSCELHTLFLTLNLAHLLKLLITVLLHSPALMAPHDFLSRRSTTTNLFETINDWSLTISNRRISSTAYNDFSRAFDSVCHNKLFYKLRSLGIEGKFLSWIIIFLSNRTIRTLVGSALSNSCPLRSGVV